MKVTELNFNAIKKYIGNRRICDLPHLCKLSKSTMYKIKKANSYQEYKGYTDLNEQIINKLAKNAAKTLDNIIRDVLTSPVEQEIITSKWYQRLPIIRVWCRWLGIK